jgi:ankyrin repeat protein
MKQQLFAACISGNLETVKYLVALGADITAYDNCVVRWALNNDHLEIVNYLVSLGADITDDNNGAIRYASSNGYLETVKYLVSLGANIDCIIKEFHKKYN